MTPLDPTFEYDRPAPALTQRSVSDLARWLMIGGPVVAGVGCFMAWIRFWVIDMPGTETDEGKFFLGAAVVGVLLGLSASAGEAHTRPRVVASLLLALLLTIFAGAQLADLHRLLDAPLPAAVPAESRQAAEEFLAQLKPGAGLYVVLAGWVAALVGAGKGLADVSE